MNDGVDEPRINSRRSPGSADRDVARNNLRAQGVRTRNLVVQAATELLLKSGGLDFTLRAVARQAKISVSNLQYYFPDRQALLRAVMAPVIESYLEDLENALNRDDVPPRELLDALIERALRDAKDSATMSLMWHFASLTFIDAECSRLFTEWYDALVRGIAKLVEKVNPDLGPAGSIQLSMLLIAMADGLGFQMWAGRERDYNRNLGESYQAMADFLLYNNPLMKRGKAAAKGGGK